MRKQGRFSRAPDRGFFATFFRPLVVRVHVFAPVAGGPLTQYVAYLLPALLQLVDEARVEAVTVTLSRPHYESAFFAEYLEPFASRVSFDMIGLPFGNRFAVAIARIRSDYVISVYADYGASILAPRCSVPDLGAALARVDSSGILHYGYTGSVHRWRERGRRTRGPRHPTGWSLPRFRRKHRWSQSHP